MIYLAKITRYGMSRGEGNDAFDPVAARHHWSVKNMKTPFFAAALVAVSAVAAFAAVEDADGNGSFSMEEVTAAYPDVTAEAFAAMDTDGSGELSQEELDAAIAAGTLAE